jgi:energy-coupling factor transport system permease protein
MTKKRFRGEQSGLHPVTWVVWTGVVAACAMSIRNPFYLVLLLGVVGVHYAAIAGHDPQERGWGMLLRLALWLVLLVVPINALGIHVGSHVLFRIPEHWPLVGGIVTLEGVLSGVVNALALYTLMLLFVCFNLEISQAQLLRLTPAFVYEAGLVLSIGLTFVPQMMVSAREIREAQLVRGHRMRRVRDALPFVMALLTTGLEHSFALAESMESRGFGRAREWPRRREILRRRDLWLQGLAVLGLMGLLSGLFLKTYYVSLRAAGWGLAAAGALLLLATFWMQGRRVLRVHYRREGWSWLDGLVLIVCLGVAAMVLTIRARSPSALAFSPYQRLLPDFSPAIGITLVALLVPLLQGRRSAQ